MAVPTHPPTATNRDTRAQHLAGRAADLAASVRAAHVSARVADALRGVALDAVVPYAADYLAPADYERLRALVDPAVGTASEVAVDALAAALADAVEESDPDLIARLDAARRWRV
jgi:hypothetical protein